MANNRILLVGAGSMAREYAKVLKALGVETVVVGRGCESAQKFSEETGLQVIPGGVKCAAQRLEHLPEKAIVAVNVEQLAPVTCELAEMRVKEILVEKPGFATPDQLDNVIAAAKRCATQIFIAYNRRFYASVMEAERIISRDGGLKSVHFEFTEWSRSVTAIERPREVFENWFYANSTHVVDLAFFLAGWPKNMSSYSAGTLDWHQPAAYVGAGVTEKEVLFSYCANWDAPGRWAVELMTSHHRLYLKPMEQLQIQQLNSVKTEPVEIDDRLDREFKPGLYLQTEAFINGDIRRLCTLEQQSAHLDNVYREIDRPCCTK